jgi:hypothetical protein
MAGCLFLSIFSSKDQGFCFSADGWRRSLRGGIICSTMQRQKGRKRKPELTDAEVRAVLVNAMADVGADPALVYAFQKTGVYVCDENETQLPKEKLKAFDGAVDEYFAALKRPSQ